MNDSTRLIKRPGAEQADEPAAAAFGPSTTTIEPAASQSPVRTAARHDSRRISDVVSEREGVSGATKEIGAPENRIS